jgi:predicted RNase H-like HicB family nuclease
MKISISTQFTIEVEQENDNRWIAEILEIPGVLVYGLTQQDAISNVQSLALRVIADKLDRGEMSLGLTTLALIPYVSEQEQGELDVMFGSPSDYEAQESIDMTDWVKHNYKERKLIQLRKQIAEGTQQIREGKVVDGEAVFQQLQEKLDRKALFEQFGDTP